MQSNKKTFIIWTIVAIIVVIGLGFLLNRPAAPSKYTDFAQKLVDGGAEFYGAFWCPHCQAQEEEFGMSRQTLEKMGLYKECSNADRSQTLICKDKKVESYPTWYFKDGITLTSTGEPTICSAAPGKDGEAATCKPIASQYFTTYVFPDHKFSIRTPNDPVKEGNVWKFSAGSSTGGELPLEFIADQIGYTLPQ